MNNYFKTICFLVWYKKSKIGMLRIKVLFFLQLKFYYYGVFSHKNLNSTFLLQCFSLTYTTQVLNLLWNKHTLSFIIKVILVNLDNDSKSCTVKATPDLLLKFYFLTAIFKIYWTKARFTKHLNLYNFIKKAKSGF